MQWKLQDAKTRLGSVVKKATDEDHQTRLTDFFKASPLHDLELDFKRSDNFTREVEL